MNLYIYDIEVFRDDWIVVLKNPDFDDNHIVIHNDNYHLRDFLSQPDIIIGGFNNKHYDDWVILTMLLGGSNIDVKKHNDFIINGGNGWEFPFVSFKKRPFKSFDLRDDIPDPALSLKAIEGNLCLPIVESSVPFDIDRPLTPTELQETIQYCKYDVDSTCRLYKERTDYITSKKVVGEMYGVPAQEAIGLTNAKLSARVLKATRKNLDDERDYTIPACLDQRLIPKQILDFFMQIRDPSIPDAKLFGTGKDGAKGETLSLWIETGGGRCPVTYAWGGVHGAKPRVTIEATDDRPIINYDVSSLYPNSMINFGYCSRAMADPDAYKKLVATRLKAKKAGDKIKADALKLVVNTVYGAMLNLYNDLADRRAGRSVCITNQLAVTQLIVMLGQACATIDFVNINTDGVMFTVNATESAVAATIVDEWCKITGFEMERDDFSKVVQKDVNNYIGIKTDGKLKTKGGYVKLYKGGDFKSNSLQIIHKAVVDYLIKGIPPEDTIKQADNIFAFQQIMKTGGSYSGAYHYVNGKRMEIQKVNRVYAVKNECYGQIVKGKWITEKRTKDKTTGKMVSTPVDPPTWQESVIPECPEHAYIDNTNRLPIDDLDLDYYITMAKDRIEKYTTIDRKIENELKKITEVITIMATTKTTTATATDVSTWNVHKKLAEARLRFSQAPVKKSGVNHFAEFKFFELTDIVPVATEIFSDLGLLFLVTFEPDKAIGTMYNTDNPEDCLTFTSPTTELVMSDKNGADIRPAKMNSIQALGAVETYQRRYLYMTALDVVENDVIDATSGKEKPATTTKKTTKPATETEREEIKTELIDKDGAATETQIKAIKNGLKKLRTKDSEQHEPYITATIKAIKAGLTKVAADDLLIEIGKKIEG